MSTHTPGPKRGTLEWRRLRQSLGGKRSRKGGQELKKLGPPACAVVREETVLVVDQLWRRVARRAWALERSMVSVAREVGINKSYLSKVLVNERIPHALFERIVRALGGTGPWLTEELPPTIGYEDGVWLAIQRSAERRKKILESGIEFGSKGRPGNRKRKGETENE